MNIIRKVKDLENISAENVYNGKGMIHCWTLLGKDPGIEAITGYPNDFESSLMFVNYAVIEKDSILGEHEHIGNEEIYYIIDGEASIIIDGVENNVSTGDIVLTKNGSKHLLTNIGENDLKVLAIASKTK